MIRAPFSCLRCDRLNIPISSANDTGWRIECGQIAENWIVQDNLTMLRQLGVITDEELATIVTPTVATPQP